MRKTNPSRGAALITGGAQRIGKEIALHLASMGYDIILHYHRSQGPALKTKARIEKEGRRCKLVRCDLSKDKAAEGLLAEAKKHFPKLNILINNASIFKKSSLKTLNTALLKTEMLVHVVSPYVLISEFSKKCKSGNIINILDTNVVKNKIGHFSYLLSKKSLYNLTQMAAVDLAPNIRVNGVAPGLILPPSGQKDNYLKRLAKSIPLKRKGHPENIAKAVEFLIENTFLTGQVIFADGGEHLLAS